MGNHILIQHTNQSDALDLLLAFDTPKGAWRIQRPDGQYYGGYKNAKVGDVFVPRAEQAVAFHSERSARNVIDISQGSAAGRARFAGCQPVLLA